MKGFTFLEAIISLSIILLLIVIIFVSLSSFRKTQELNNAVEETVSLINLARSKTLSSESSSQYGVHFELSRVVLFKGTVFSDSSPDNKVSLIPELIEISVINLNGGGSDLIFQRLNGKTDNYGTIVVRIKSDVTRTKTIEIKSTGIANVL